MADALDVDDFADLKRICRWSVIYDGAESRFDQIGQCAAKILWRHGVHAYVDGDNGKINFEKVG